MDPLAIIACVNSTLVCGHDVDTELLPPKYFAKHPYFLSHEALLIVITDPVSLIKKKKIIYPVFPLFLVLSM